MFRKDVTRSRGYIASCKKCNHHLDVKIIKKRSEKRKQERERKISLGIPVKVLKLNSDERRISQARQNAIWKARFPERSKAHSIVYSALKWKKISKLPCLVCGDRSEAHHPDYSRPLDVVWLCRTHHKQAHMLAI